MDSNFEEIFQGWLEKEESTKNKGFLKKNKQWKKYFCVLRHYDGDDNVYFQWFMREEDWRKEFPVGSFGLFPKYSVYKRKNEKNKGYFEVSNDDDYHCFMASNERTMDLWVIQLMMQTRLNSTMVENGYRVKGGDSKCLQRIGAKNLNCLLHVSEWGMTLALERTHAVLSQWPLTTIRNYECTDNNEFVFEAGRKSPMGEGKYQFLTTNSEDNEIFDQLDRFTSLRAKRVRGSGGRSRLNSGDEEEIAQAYGKLRWSVMLNSSSINLGVIQPMSSAPQAIAGNDRQLYNHLQRQNSSQSTASTAICGSYDHLGRNGSFSDQNARMNDPSYSRLDCSKSQSERKASRSTVRSPNDSYDHLERTESVGSSSSFESRSKSLGSMERRSRFQFTSPPDDSYHHLDEYRRSSWSTSPGGGDEYNRLDRSNMSVNQAPPMNSYDRLDTGQGVVRNQSTMQSPTLPELPNDGASFDPFSSNVGRDYNNLPSPPLPERRKTPSEPVPPPLPQKPSFMIPNTPKDDSPLEGDVRPNMGENSENTKIELASMIVNGVDKAASSPHLTSIDTQYQELDEARGDGYDVVRSRLNTHSSDPDLRGFSREENGLDPSKRTTLHRSAPSLALYSVVNKKKADKSSRKIHASTSKLDSFFKRIGRGSKKDDLDLANGKIDRKSKRSRRKLEKLGSTSEIQSTSSLRRLIPDNDRSAYAEINENDIHTQGGGRKMERSESSKRPLPDLPLVNESGMNI